ncbi:nitrous oxide reductase family maturation protein NosD [Paenibacillus sp. PDC88]|uniref:right-handed parallel beta-helix repeat-containing protein n=1 Tax=Paenibacillus sp. PDC88 TaxID=1884375 RepID=UPI0008975BB5|nr:right-handed parallel beta-helix repeat-containing protein [Paenibacillus sp. PDC88]SDW73987.1 nitrous oxidase accessory protein [Paenibacillus sp. PDC88]
MGMKKEVTLPRFIFIYIVIFVIFLGCLLYTPAQDRALASRASDPNAEVTKLQPLIDQAGEGDQLVLPAGTYAGPVVIDKKISIIGEGIVQIINRENKPAVEITQDHVTMNNLTIRHESKGREAGVLVRADYVTLEGLQIRSEGYGIVLRDAHYNLIHNNNIEGTEVRSLENLNNANGIDLFKSNHNDIQNNEIRYVMDGIYIESCQSVHVASNNISDVRYAVHFMYVNDSEMLNNTGQNNVTGAMVMGVNNATISGNIFRKQSKNVNAQGMYLFDVHDSIIEQNRLEGNRIGVYIQSSTHNQFRENALIENFVGIQAIHSEQNVIESNDLISNVNEAVAMGSKDNQMSSNYWDSFQGIDSDGDHSSDIAHSINPFYLNLVNRNSAYQLFFQSPGLTFLSEMFTQDQRAWLKDPSPVLMTNTDLVADTSESERDSNLFLLLAGLSILLISAYIILFLGVKRS